MLFLPQPELAVGRFPNASTDDLIWSMSGQSTFLIFLVNWPNLRPLMTCFRTKKNDNPSKSQYIYIFNFYIFNNIPCICHNQGKKNESKRFWFRVTIRVTIFSSFFLVCLKIAQLSFKWADICSWEDAHLLRFNSGELATLSLDESWMKWQKKKEVYNSLHKRLKCLSVSIYMITWLFFIYT